MAGTGGVRGMREARTLEQVAQQDEGVLHNIEALGGQFQYTLLPGSSYKQLAVAIEVGLDDLLARIVLGLIDGTDLLKLLARQVAGADGALPGDGPLADVGLQRCEICRGVGRHGDGRWGLDAAGWRCVDCDSAWC